MVFRARARRQRETDAARAELRAEVEAARAALASQADDAARSIGEQRNAAHAALSDHVTPILALLDEEHGRLAAFHGEASATLDRLEAATALLQPVSRDRFPPPNSRLVLRTGGPTPRGAVCAAATGRYIELLAIAAPTLDAYASRWGLDLVLSTERDLAQGRPASWARVPLVRELLQRYPWVLWVDSDALVVDPDVDVLAEAREGKDLYLVEHDHEHPHHPGILQRSLNAAVLLARAGPWMDSFLAEVWDSEDLIDHAWWENSAIMRLLGYSYELPNIGPAHESERRERLQVLDLRWNSVPHLPGLVSPSPVISHHGGGLTFQQRRARMLEDADALRRGDPLPARELVQIG
jgi:hypothetical protein